MFGFGFFCELILSTPRLLEGATYAARRVFVFLRHLKLFANPVTIAVEQKRLSNTWSSKGGVWTLLLVFLLFSLFPLLHPSLGR